MFDSAGSGITYVLPATERWPYARLRTERLVRIETNRRADEQTDRRPDMAVDDDIEYMNTLWSRKILLLCVTHFI